MSLTRRNGRGAPHFIVFLLFVSESGVARHEELCTPITQKHCFFFLEGKKQRCYVRTNPMRKSHDLQSVSAQTTVLLHDNNKRKPWSKVKEPHHCDQYHPKRATPILPGTTVALLNVGAKVPSPVWSVFFCFLFFCFYSAFQHVLSVNYTHETAVDWVSSR